MKVKNSTPVPSSGQVGAVNYPFKKYAGAVHYPFNDVRVRRHYDAGRRERQQQQTARYKQSVAEMI